MICSKRKCTVTHQLLWWRISITILGLEMKSSRKNFMGEGIPVSSPKKKFLAWNDSEILETKFRNSLPVISHVGNANFNAYD